MVDVQQIRAQLKQLDRDPPFWVDPEVRELPRILVEGETIKHLVNGRYNGGFAILCATDQRLLLVDKKPLFLAVEDIRYDMISEVDYSHQLIGAVVRANSFNKKLLFKSLRKDDLRKLVDYIQERLTQVRTQYARNENQGQYVPQVGLPEQQLPAAPVVATTPATVSLPPAPQPETEYGPTIWQAVGHSMLTSHTYDSSPPFIRRRVSKFGLPRTSGQY